jgi:putative membrane protein
MTIWGVYLRGALMGAADIVPGVSGGTMAFITGIYDRLLAALRCLDLAALRMLLRGQWRSAWQHVDGNFLAALLAGILTSVVTLARGISWLLAHYPVPLWAFFFGLILASALVVLRQVAYWRPGQWLALGSGAGLAAVVALSPTLAPVEPGLLSVFLAGFIAICAMILPGISGSFILVLLGMYAPILGALRDLQPEVLLVFALGAGSGLLCFSRLLHWLLRHYHALTMALLTGFLAGSLLVVWPWKRPLSWVMGSDGEPRPVQEVPVSPGAFAELGADPYLLPCLLLMVGGFLLVWWLERRWGQS